jgi:flagellar hook-associated protein 3 FlgL
MRITENMSADNALYNIQKGRAKLNRIQEQIASELNYLRPSDDPISTRYILDLENKLKESNQYVKNIKNADIWVSVTDHTLTSMGELLTLAKSTVSNILGGSNDQTLTKMAVNQLTEYKKQLIDLGNTQVGDDYIFGGFKNKNAPFRNDVWTLQSDTVVGSTAVANVDTTSLMVGMPVTGAGIPPNTTVSAINGPNALTLSQAAIAGAGVGTFLTFGMDTQVTADLQTGSTTLKNVNNLNNLSVGMKINGAGIPQGTTITGIAADSRTITISNAATATSAGTALAFTIPNSISGKTNAGVATVYNIFDTTGLQPGMSVSGAGIPANTTIVSVDSKNQITLSKASLQTIDGVMLSYNNDGVSAGTITANTTNGTNTVTTMNTNGLASGMQLTGTGIPSDAKISQVIPAVPGPFAGDRTSGSKYITFPAPPAGLAAGMPVTGTGIQPGSTVVQPNLVRSGAIFGILGPGGGSIVSVDTAGLVAGLPVTAATIPAGTTISAVYPPPSNQPMWGVIDSGSLNVLGGLGATTALLQPGMTVTGPNIVAGTTITAIGPLAGEITLSTPASGAGTGAFSFGGVVELSSNTAPAGADTLTFDGVIEISSPATATTNANDVAFGGVLTIDKTATATATGATLTLPLTGDISTTAPGTTVSNVFDTTNMAVGMTVAGPGIPSNTTITAKTATTITLSNAVTMTAVGSPFSIKLSGDTTAGSAVLSNIFDTSTLTVGMPITGAGIPADTVITAVNPHSVTLSQNATATATNVLLDRAISGNTQAQSKVLTGLFSTASLLVGMPVRGTGIPDNTVITAINSPTSISISNAPTATANGISLSFDRDYTGFFGTDDALNVEIDHGVSFAMNISGGRLLRGEVQNPVPPATQVGIDIIRTLDNLITAIANNDSASILKGVNDLKLSNDQMNDAKAEVAGKILRLDSAEKLHTRTENTMKDLISQRQDLDTTKAAVELNKQNTAFEATLSATAKIMQISILDYLK